MSHDNELAPETCPSCEFGPFARNAYWMGKLMLPRDFIDEQRYFMDKLRHHHVHLHGWGVVCGLTVVPHDTTACRHRFVCVEPGVAIDCCGHDLILPERECIDLLAVPAIKALVDAGNTEPHVLQVCIRYRECPTEQVPVLYDDCGCDSDRCAPNRILESYELGVLVDPAPPAEPPPAIPCGDIWADRAAFCELCDTADCVVLATITGYVAGQPVEETQIDNTARKLLPSNQTIKEVIDCLLLNGGGGGGGGGPGLDAVELTMVDCGQAGSAAIEVDGAGTRTLVLEIPNGCPPGIASATVTMVDCATPASAVIDTDGAGNRVLELTIPSGCGQDVPSGLDDITLTMVDCDQPARAEIVTDGAGNRVIELEIPTCCEKLSHLCGISWKHNAFISRDELERGLYIAFDNKVQADDLRNAVVVLARDRETGCWCEIDTEQLPGDFSEPCVVDPDKFEPSGDPFVTAVWLRPAPNQVTPQLRVLVKGDFLRDAEGKGVDANHLPPWFGGAPDYRTGDGVEGGTFESWFMLD
ncbi:DUF4402 domain-containing protein [Pseudoduganella umbonata]|uniref:Uncharacterized protein n=1 Tax=Pseudoduganella umbonata TaxID=864828 RepID=A0A4P8HJH2_9BURK|nr:DUF4402 domain-containing protein [Pseudoduganella umbonata]MBB3219828.1 hypothetical protein [Pseudoduganella umbonata]QCP09859.1 hypothetical protein FCL38_05050 [Pseudoduganella umbonata]